jgi:drug/metabolite transporter (DMT)-like permease
VVTFPLYFGLIRDLGPGRAAYNSVVVPIVTMALSTVFEDYRWSMLAAFGAALALAGMFVALRARNLPPGRAAPRGRL